MAIRIRFTKHAKDRCIQRRVSEQWVMARLQKIPFAEGTHEHIFEGTDLKAVFHDEGNLRLVITVYPILMEDVQPKSKKKVDLTEVKPMINKEIQKYKRRKKYTKKTRPPNR